MILILTVIVGMTVALAVYFDSLTDVTITSTEDRSERAFNAAEGGVEDLISRNDEEIADLIAQTGGETVVSVGDLSANVSVAEQLTIESLVNRNDVVTVKLEGGTLPPSVRISWTHSNEACGDGDGHRPGILVERWYTEANQTKVERQGFSAVGCTSTSQFTVASPSSDPGYHSAVRLALNANDLLLRVQPVFNQTTILATGEGGDLPPQSVEIVSKANAGQSNETRAIRANRSYSDLPAIFDYTVYSGSNLVKE